MLEQSRRARAEGFLELAASPTISTEATEDDRPGEPSGGGPTVIGKYGIVRRFAEASGQAAAYLAFDPDLERHVVLKRYHGEAGEAEEGRALAKVASPFVARCYGIERIEGSSTWSSSTSPAGTSARSAATARWTWRGSSGSSPTSPRGWRPSMRGA